MKKMNVLFTGGTGFIGKNIIPFLTQDFIVYSPRRNELNLFDKNEVREYLINNKIDIVVHSANPNPSKNDLDTNDRMLKDSLQMFLSFYESKSLVKKIIYLGSGAIYDKTRDILSVQEENYLLSFPKDDYGFAKYVMNHLTKDNIYNLCVFGCYGPYDAESKFITHCIRCCLRNEPITIRKNCFFDYMHVYDLAKIIKWAINNDLKHNFYNACSGKRITLLEIAQEVKKQMQSKSDIVLLSNEWNYEYTGSNSRLIKEYNGTFIPIEEGIKMQIEWEKKTFNGGK